MPLAANDDRPDLPDMETLVFVAWVAATTEHMTSAEIDELERERR